MINQKTFESRVRVTPTPYHQRQPTVNVTDTMTPTHEAKPSRLCHEYTGTFYVITAGGKMVNTMFLIDIFRRNSPLHPKKHVTRLRRSGIQLKCVHYTGKMPPIS